MYPHCDNLVLHAPTVCMFCDKHPKQQQQRIKDKINFTGQNNPNFKPCPSTLRRSLETIENWHGNVPMTEKQFEEDYLAVILNK